MSEQTTEKRVPRARARVGVAVRMPDPGLPAGAQTQSAIDASPASLGALPPERRELAPFLRAMDDLFEPQDLLRKAHVLGVIDRSRKKDLPKLVTATVLALSGPAGMQTNVRNLYHDLGGLPVASSSFYEWFYGPFHELMGSLAERAIKAVEAAEAAQEGEPKLANPLRRLLDVSIMDSTSKTLGKIAKCWAPSTSEEHGGIKIHAICSLDSPIIQMYETTVQTTSDSVKMSAEQFKRGTLVLYDLGYVDHRRESEFTSRGIYFLRRLKDSENPVIRNVVTANSSVGSEGVPLRDAMRDDKLIPGDTVDVDVIIAAAHEHRFSARVVGVRGPDGYIHWYATNMPREWLNAEDAPAAYSLRWEIELVFKSMKSGLGFDTIRARRPDALMALVHAKVIALALSRLLYLAATEKAGPLAVTQMAIVVTMTRMLPVFVIKRANNPAFNLLDEEERLISAAIREARPRNQRRLQRQREKRLILSATP